MLTRKVLRVPPPVIVHHPEAERLVREVWLRLPEPRPPIGELHLEEITPATAQLLLEVSDAAVRPMSPDLREAVAKNDVPCFREAFGIHDGLLLCGGRHRSMAIVEGGHPVVAVIRRTGHAPAAVAVDGASRPRRHAVRASADAVIVDIAFFLRMCVREDDDYLRRNPDIRRLYDRWRVARTPPPPMREDDRAWRKDPRSRA